MPANTTAMLHFMFADIYMSHIRVTATVVTSAAPRKFETMRVKENSTPISRAVALSVASSDPWKGTRACCTAAKAEPPAIAAVETFHTADRVLELDPEDALPSRLNSPQSPTS